MVPIAPWAIFGTVYNSASGMVPLVYVIGLVAMVFTATGLRADGQVVPVGGVGVLLCGPRRPPEPAGFFAGWAILLDYLLVPTLLYVFAAESMIGLFPEHAAVAVGDRVRRRQHHHQPARYRLAEDGQPGVPRHRIGLRRRSSWSSRCGRSAAGHCPTSGWSTTPIWNPDVVSAPLIASALSIAVLSFLGFDGISTLAEESTGTRNPAGRAMIMPLFVVAFLFIAQTWLASLLAGGRESFSDDEAGNAFFTLVEAASNTGWMNAFFVVNVLAVGFANAMAAQAATSRLLYSMSRDRQLPRLPVQDQ